MERMVGHAVHPQRFENCFLDQRGSTMLLTPNIPVFCFNAPGVGGCSQLRLFRTPGRRIALDLVHVIIGSWMAILSFNRVFRRAFSHALTMRTMLTVLKALSRPLLIKPSIGAARIPFGPCRSGWHVAPSK